MQTRPTLADEIKMTRPFANKAAEATLALMRTANVLKRRFEALIASENISLQQYNVLRILRGARGPLPTMEIAERMIEQQPGITRHVNNLEEQGYIRREQWAGDRRQVLCQITPLGLKLLERLDDPVLVADSEATGNLDDEQLDNLIAYLAEIRRANLEASGKE